MNLDWAMLIYGAIGSATGLNKAGRDNSASTSRPAPNDKRLLVWSQLLLGSCGTGTLTLARASASLSRKQSTGKSAGATKAWSFLVSTCRGGAWLRMTSPRLFGHA